MTAGFDILVNGIPRTFRDVEATAIEAGRILKRKDLKAEIIVINAVTREWLIITDVAMDTIVWRPPAEMPAARPE